MQWRAAAVTVILQDGNNFYSSVERAFDPQLRGKPIIVLSNNDGCAIARSNEAKALGVQMGQPLHEIDPKVRKQLVVRSANFGLYGDISGRIVTIMRDLFPHVEIYSIDENWATSQGVRDPVDLARTARGRILQWTGIPCAFGLAETKTLGKVANKLAKKAEGGVVDLRDPAARDATLASFPVDDVWGVGRRFAARLGQEGILTAGDLARADPHGIRSRYGVVLARTQRELQGHRCIELEEHEPPRQQIVVSRSFGKVTSDPDAICEAVATFAIRAAEKLRARGLVAGGAWVWLNTNPFREGAPQYHPSRAQAFPMPTSDTREILAVTQAIARAMHRRGYAFQKAGVGLLDLTERDTQQGDLFASVAPRAQALMDVLDQANQKFGRGTMGFASSGWRAKPVWGMRQDHLSRSYTTRWDQLLRVR